jgi:hypothetical protein
MAAFSCKGIFGNLCLGSIKIGILDTLTSRGFQTILREQLQNIANEQASPGAQ